MKHLLSKFVVTAAIAALTPLTTLYAATPPGIFVIATQIGEFTTLDPSEIYELVPSEYVANVYERLVQMDLNDPTNIETQQEQTCSVCADGTTN
ncbi:MAG: ABC transporter substrate-binding protein, partial [Trinickia sp.]